MWRGKEEKGKRIKLELRMEHVVREFGQPQLTCKYGHRQPREGWLLSRHSLIPGEMSFTRSFLLKFWRQTLASSVVSLGNENVTK